MLDITWDTLLDRPRYGADELGSQQPPDSPGVYVWWRGDEPVYVDCAHRLRIRLTRIDTHAAGERSRLSTFRGRVALWLRQAEALDDATLGDERHAAIDRWISRHSVSWTQARSYADAQQGVARLLRERTPELHIWRPRPGEDEWLLRYFDRRGGSEEAGRFYVEVPVGGPERYGPGAKTRFIDAVRVPNVNPGGISYYQQDAFESEIAGQPVEIIEVKKSLNRTVIGQLLVAQDLVEVEWPEHGPLRLVALCTQGDPALEWICEHRGIDVETVARGRR